MTKKSLLLVLSLVLALAIGLGGTLAYLTDTDAEVNTFTIGDVDIELDEEYEQDQPINPGVEVDKIVKIENVSANDAWVWYTVAIPVAGEGEDAEEVIIPTYNEIEQWTKLDNVQALEIEGEMYNVYTFLWNDVLPGGEATEEGLQKIQMHPSIDYDPISGTYKFIEGGKEVGTIDYDLTAGKVYVNAYAIQTEGFTSVEAAYAGFMGQWTEDGKNYTEGMILAGSELVGVSTPEELEEAIAQNKNIELKNDIDLSGYDWQPYGDKDEGIYYTGMLDGKGYTVSGLNLDGDNSQDGYVGLIGAADGAVIRNLTVEGTVKGENAAGIVARLESGRVENCVNKVDVVGTEKAGGIVCLANKNGCVIVDCTNEGDVTAPTAAGGIVGYCNPNAVIDSCVNNGAIGSSSTKYAGGMTGYGMTGTSTYTDCINNGTVDGNNNVGGIGGIFTGDWKVSGCTNNGVVTAHGSATAGSIVGTLYGTQIEDCVDTANSVLKQVGKNV